MSHFVKIQTQFKQLEPLRKAFEHFGWKITENAKARTYSGDSTANTKYNYVAVNPGQDGSMTFDLGINRKEDGELEIFGDTWGGSVSKTLGQNFEGLKRQYARNVLEEHYAYYGASVSVTENEDSTMFVDVEMA